MVDLLIEVACFVTKVNNNFGINNLNWLAQGGHVY
jgi:hypothetical protein